MTLELEVATLPAWVPPMGNSMSNSIGVAFFEPSTGETLDSLISRADAAMYVAKKTGKGSYYISKK